MKKKFKIASIIIVSMLILTSCGTPKTEVDRKTETVSGTVVFVSHHKPITKLYTPIKYISDYDTCIDYNQERYLLDSPNAYNICKDKVGETIECEITTIYYDDNTTGMFLTVEGYR